jgi:2-polyprenyl-3-methyl-5-hydroxy-6-metoxy-1,4-benzoquinol methylase
MEQNYEGSVNHSALGSVAPEWYYKASHRELLPLVPTSSRRVLEIGCAEGKFGRLVKDTIGAEVWGVELNPEVAEKAKTNLDVVFTGDAAQVIGQFEKKLFDCIVLFDVIEHLANPFYVIDKAKSLLSDKGCVAFCFPNVLYISNLYKLLVKKDWKYTDYGILDITHLRYFTKKSFVNTARDLGYKVEHIEGINPIGNVNRRNGILFSLFNILTLSHFYESCYYQFVGIMRPLR